MITKEQDAALGQFAGQAQIIIDKSALDDESKRVLTDLFDKLTKLIVKLHD